MLSIDAQYDVKHDLIKGQETYIALPWYLTPLVVIYHLPSNYISANDQLVLDRRAIVVRPSWMWCMSTGSVAVSRSRDAATLCGEERHCIFLDALTCVRWMRRRGGRRC